MKKAFLTVALALFAIALSSKENEKTNVLLEDPACAGCEYGHTEGETFAHCGTVYLCSEGEYWELECQ